MQIMTHVAIAEQSYHALAFEKKQKKEFFLLAIHFFYLSLQSIIINNIMWDALMKAASI